MKQVLDFKLFANCARDSTQTLGERSLAFLYFHSRFGNGGAEVNDIVADFEIAGLGKPRSTRVRTALIKDRRTKKVGPDSWMIPADKFGEIESELNLGSCLTAATTKEKALRRTSARKSTQGLTFIDSHRIKELRNTSPTNYDLSRLLKICYEINDNFPRRNYIATILLVRTLLDHVSPIFGLSTFKEVANNYKATRSLKDSLQHLENSSRKIADGHLHTPIRNREVLPTAAQVNFSQDLDTLLGEIVRILK